MKRLTDRMQAIMTAAEEEATRRGHNYVGTEHVLIALAKSDSGVAHYVLEELGLTGKIVEDKVVEVLGWDASQNDE